MINVLWVDDLIINPDGTETDFCKSFVNSAYDEGIDITPFATYNEAYSEIEKNPSKWIAIILDVRNDQAIEGNENQDYLSMRRRIEYFRREHNNRVEPFIFVFSADPVTISDAKRYFIKDADIQSKEVYNKPDDVNVLFKDIKEAAKQSTIYATYKKYENIFNAMEEMEWSKEDQNIVFSLIKNIDSDNDYKNDTLYNEIRKLLEVALYTKLEKSGIMDDFVKLKNEYVDDTINKRSLYMGKNQEVPLYIQRAFHSLTMIAQNGSHYHATSPNLVVARDTRLGNAPYLLKSCLYDLLNIIIWEAKL
ncbi:MAG: hypothetical protein MJZ41_02660 [Bacteroidaceae bacterium]|nr:hypothetical protein [Bacteroidaceae bacterium]